MDDKKKYVAQLSNATTRRGSQDSSLWSAFGIFAAANAILMVALFTSGGFPEAPVGVILSSIGITFVVVWALIQHRAIKYIDSIDSLVSRIEKHLRIEEYYRLSSIYPMAGFSARWTMRVFILLTASGWLVGLGYFSFKLNGA